MAHADSDTYRGIQINEDGTGNVFTAASLGEEGLERAPLSEILSIGVRTAVGLQAMLEQVSEDIGSIEILGMGKMYGNVQLPGAITELRAGLADVKVADLERNTN